MEIAIIGGGAVGSAYAALLSRVAPTTLIVRRAEHAEAVARDGITVTHDGNQMTYRPRVTTEPHAVAKADLVLVLTKTYDTEAASQTIAEYVGASATIASLQNGLGAIDVLNSIYGRQRVLAGITSIAAVKRDDVSIDLSHIGEAVVGEQDMSASRRCNEAAGCFTAAGFNGVVASDIWTDIWTKLGLSVGQNALSALCSMTFGEMAASEAVCEIARLLTDEFLAVASTEGIHVRYEPFDRLMSNWQKASEHRSSTWQDLAADRRTEIDAINGAMVRLGNLHGIATPVNATITNLIKAREPKV